MKKPIKNNDLLLKILSAVIALGLWFYVVQVESPDIDRTIKDVPVTFTQRNILEEKNLILLNDNEYTVDVKIRGPRKYVMDVDSENLTVRADVSNIEATGQHIVMTNILLPYANLEILNKDPSSLTVEVDHLETTERSVEILTIGNPKSTYIVGKLTSNQQTVSIKGPKTVLDGINSVAATIDVSGKSADTAGLQKLSVLDNNGKEIKTHLLTYSPESVEVHAEILKTKAVKLTPTFVQGTHDYVLDENSIKEIQIAGIESLVENLTEIHTKPINLNRISDTGEISITLDLPQGVRSISGDTFSLRFSKASENQSE